MVTVPKLSGAIVAPKPYGYGTAIHHQPYGGQRGESYMVLARQWVSSTMFQISQTRAFRRLRQAFRYNKRYRLGNPSKLPMHLLLDNSTPSRHHLRERHGCHCDAAVLWRLRWRPGGAAAKSFAIAFLL